MKKFKNLFILITLLFFTSSSYAADVTVEMLNKLGISLPKDKGDK